jgi:hypothetical protein
LKTRVVCLLSSAGVTCVGALSLDIPDRFITSAQHASAVSDDLFHTSVLRPELFEQLSSESAQLLQSASRTR